MMGFTQHTLYKEYFIKHIRIELSICMHTTCCPDTYSYACKQVHSYKWGKQLLRETFVMIKNTATGKYTNPFNGHSYVNTYNLYDTSERIDMHTVKFTLLQNFLNQKYSFSN